MWVWASPLCFAKRKLLLNANALIFSFLCITGSNPIDRHQEYHFSRPLVGHKNSGKGSKRHHRVRHKPWRSSHGSGVGSGRQRCRYCSWRRQPRLVAPRSPPTGSFCCRIRPWDRLLWRWREEEQGWRGRSSWSPTYENTRFSSCSLIWLFGCLARLWVSIYIGIQQCYCLTGHIPYETEGLSLQRSWEIVLNKWRHWVAFSFSMTPERRITQAHVSVVGTVL